MSYTLTDFARVSDTSRHTIEVLAKAELTWRIIDGKTNSRKLPQPSHALQPISSRATQSLVPTCDKRGHRMRKTGGRNRRRAGRITVSRKSEPASVSPSGSSPSVERSSDRTKLSW
jgi:hypothetical protein